MHAVGSSFWAAGFTWGGFPYGVSEGQLGAASEETNRQASWGRQTLATDAAAIRATDVRVVFEWQE